MSQSEMRQSRVDPAIYTDPEIYRGECQAIEDDAWNYLGLVSDLPARNSFLTVSVARRSVIVQNFADGIKVFDNVCGHRACRIRSEPKGSGPIRCPYHSWTFGSDGAPIAIPNNDECFGINDDNRSQFSLNAWRVELCGRFVFAKRRNGGGNLRDYLSDFFAPLEQMSNAIGEEVASDTWEFDANWKICIENTLDEYHANFVHPTTFRNLLSSGFQYEYAGRHSGVVTRATDEALARWRKIDRMIGDRPIANENYQHVIAFPLTTFASTFGATFSIQAFTPLTPTRTRFTSRLFLTEGVSSAQVKAVLGDSAATFNRQVFSEDKEVCELMQLGIAEGSGRVVTGKYEQRIRHFQETMAVFCAEAALKTGRT
ncbi:aromatic ring-hydroxylating dioxygenase subunit alpha [Brevundimonas kwangchunensis]|uniref:Aromatic ring-hydroxylating dioxygenase subunit alpha n=1 Tax=Brevundimonas kwangchunensis TaxID=322163 RepID=A0ABN1GGJ5_9CAUL